MASDTNTSTVGSAGLEAGPDGIDAGEAWDPEESPSGLYRLSCEQCRQRKIRCDRSHPCTPCTRKDVKCTFPAGFKPRQRRQRAVISNLSEDKINDISRKLDRICVAVDNFGGSPSAMSDGFRSSHGPSVTHKTPGRNAAPSEIVQSTDDSGTHWEGELSLTAHAVYAANYAQQAMSVNDPINVSPEMTSSIGALRKIVGEFESQNSGGRQHRPQLIVSNAGTGEVQMPPIQVAMSCLQLVKDDARVKYFWSFEFETVGQVVEYLLTVYSGDPSIADLIIVNSTLDRLFIECSYFEAEESRKTALGSHAASCRRNVELILSRLPFDLPNTFDYILALYLASMHSLDRCRPLKAWKYIVSAAQMCQVVGYNRDIALVPEDAIERRRRIRIFWYIVMVEKMLSLRLGRPSTIRDSDITIRHKEVIDKTGVQLVPLLPKWIAYALVQGKVYDDLYSPGALQQPESIRAVRARALAIELQTLFEEHCALESKYLKERHLLLGDTMHELFIRADKVSHLATMTLIYRGIPPNPYAESAFCEEGIAMAHAALEEHQQCLALLKNVDGHILELYIQWAILASPFVPYIVLFCRVVETGDPIRLEMLGSVVEALQLVPHGFPEAFSRQSRLFKLMYDVACKFVDAKGTVSTGRAQGRISRGDFDVFFREAEMEPPTQPPAFGGQTSSRQAGHGGGYGTENGANPISLEAIQEAFVSAADTNGAELGSWFDQNQQIMRMMEDI